MKKIIAAWVILGFILSGAGRLTAAEYKAFEIKVGAHEDKVKEKYGEPLMSRDLKNYFLPIPRKRVLYGLGDAVYVILDYYSGRVKGIVILEETTPEEAESLFNE